MGFHGWPVRAWESTVAAIHLGWSFGMPATAHLTAALACSHFAASLLVLRQDSISRMFEKSRLCSPLAILDLANPAIGCLSEMHRYLTIIEVLATIGVAKLLAFAAMNPNMLLEVAARHRHLELVFTMLPACQVLFALHCQVLGLETVEEAMTVRATVQGTGSQWS